MAHHDGVRVPVSRPCFTLLFVTMLVTVGTTSSLSSSPRRDAFQKSVVKAAASFLPPPPPGTDLISSSLISQLAVLAIKSRLKQEREVLCEVAFSSSNLLINGLVGPVTVKGKDWGSGRGLTCRAIEATVDQCELDASKIISHRKLLLTKPAIGRAMVALNARDFGNFILHPLLKPPDRIPRTKGGDAVMEFLSEGCVIDPHAASVTFFATYSGSKWRCALTRSQSDPKARVKVWPTLETDDSEAMALQLGQVLQDFFNEMVFDLDGTFLSFRDMMITDKGEAPSVMISLNIKVRKLPSPGIDF
jgi:hypothetical protein